MSVIAVLGREHRLFEKLIARLRPAPQLEPEQARAQIVQALGILIPALGRHDRLEDLVFGRPDVEWPQRDQLACDLVEAQHGSVRALVAELKAVQADENAATLTRLTALARVLAEKLKWHFETEEMLLWPVQARRAGRSVEHSVALQAERNLRDFEAAVAKTFSQAYS